jgi:hypothetical protein
MTDQNPASLPVCTCGTVTHHHIFGCAAWTYDVDAPFDHNDPIAVILDCIGVLGTEQWCPEHDFVDGEHKCPAFKGEEKLRPAAIHAMRLLNQIEAERNLARGLRPPETIPSSSDPTVDAATHAPDETAALRARVAELDRKLACANEVIRVRDEKMKAGEIYVTPTIPKPGQYPQMIKDVVAERDAALAQVATLTQERDEAQQWIDSDPDWKNKFIAMMATKDEVINSSNSRIAELEQKLAKARVVLDAAEAFATWQSNHGTDRPGAKILLAKIKEARA